jgi:hypothetical protein
MIAFEMEDRSVWRLPTVNSEKYARHKLRGFKYKVKRIIPQHEIESAILAIQSDYIPGETEARFKEHKKNGMISPKAKIEIEKFFNLTGELSYQ